MARDRRDREDAVRRLLADLHHSEPMPVDVAARLDDVLAQLDVDREVDAPVVDLAAQRRRRGVRMLGAAAAVVVLGVGVSHVVSPRSSDSTSSDSTASGAADAGAGSATSGEVPESAAPQALSDLPADSAEISGESSAADSYARLAKLRGSVVRLTDANFVATVQRLRRADTRRNDSMSTSTYSVTTDDDASALRFSARQGCEPAAWGTGRKLAVRYEGEPAVLVFRKRTGQSQVVDLLQCGTATVLRSITLH